MSATSAVLPAPSPAPLRRLHPVPVRIMHWTNAVAMLVMIGSGWGIYNDSVIFSGLHFSKHVRLGSWAAQSLLWHFAGMWLLVLNGLRLPALWPGDRPPAGAAAADPAGRRDRKPCATRCSCKIAHEDLTVYNAVQKLLYIVVILAGVSQVVTGLAIWKPVQFSGPDGAARRVPGGAADPLPRHGGHRGLPGRARRPVPAGAAEPCGPC